MSCMYKHIKGRCSFFLETHCYGGTQLNFAVSTNQLEMVKLLLALRVQLGERQHAAHPAAKASVAEGRPAWLGGLGA